MLTLFAETFTEKKSIKIRYSLTWRHSKKCKICVTFSKTIYLYSCLWKQPFRKISKIKLSSETAIKMHFSISLLCTYSEILWKTFAIFSKLSCNALQLEPQYQFMWNNYFSRKPLESSSVFWKSGGNVNPE